MTAAHVTAMIMAAGKGARFGGDVPKQYLPLAGTPPLLRALKAFESHASVDEVICVVDEDATPLFQSLMINRAVPRSVVGGATRQQSVANALEKLARDTVPPDIVLIHDAARPLAPSAVIDDVLSALQTTDAAAPSLPAADTVCLADGEDFGEDLDRSKLRRRQTPQGFRFSAILAAHRAHQSFEATDDIALARMAGMTTRSVPGSERLHKLTSQEDQRILEAMLTTPGVPSVGNGFDVHAFGVGDHVTLCGVDVPHSHGLTGHSDADVAMHALTDAMLGAVGAGDIGQLFPPSDPQWKGAASSIFLTRALREIEAENGRLESVDVTIICETPKVGPHRETMRRRLAELLGIPERRVNVKATTTEKLGFAGRGEGVAAMATATVTLIRTID